MDYGGLMPLFVLCLLSASSSLIRFSLPIPGCCIPVFKTPVSCFLIPGSCSLSPVSCPLLLGLKRATVSSTAATIPANPIAPRFSQRYRALPDEQPGNAIVFATGSASSPSHSHGTNSKSDGSGIGRA